MKIRLEDFLVRIEACGYAISPADVAVLVQTVAKLTSVVSSLSMVVEAQKEMLDKLVGPNKHIYAKLEDVIRRLKDIEYPEVPDAH